MIVAQTFATDKYDSLTNEAKREMLLFHFLSALTIKKQLKEEDRFVLITDTKGKLICQELFPYDEYITVLDYYPHDRPLSMSSYKMFSLEVFKNKTFVHFDNDVYLFRPILEFKDVLIQSEEGGFAEAFCHNKLKGEQWELPDYALNVKNNYNPGIFGFTADSIVREEYLNTFNYFYFSNLKRIKSLPVLEREFYLKNICDINLILEESVLYHLCQEREAKVVEMIPDKFKEHQNVWGALEHGRFIGLDWSAISKVSHEKWREEKYYHAIGEKNFKPKNFQEALQEVYRTYTKEVDQFLKDLKL